MRWSAEQPVDRLIQPFATQVPQRAVDGADRQHRVALAAMHHTAMHLIPELLAGNCVLTDQIFAQVLSDDVGDAFRDRAGKAGNAFIRMDLHEMRGDLEPVGSLNASFVIVSDPVFRIDIDGTNEPFLPKIAVGRQRALQATKTDFSN